MSDRGPRIPVAAVALVTAFALLLGFWGNSALQGLVGDREGEGTADLDTGDLDQRTDRLGGQLLPEAPPPPGPEAPPPSRDTQTAAEDPELRAIRERLAADLAWREERARLASDSPLTPGVTETADMARRGMAPPAEPQTSAPPAPEPAAPDEAARPPSAAAADSGPEAPLHVLERGSVIPAVLKTPVDSDLPGLVLAQVTEPVFDSLTGSHMLIPPGSRLVGVYGSGASAGQRRMFISWTDLRMPDGTPLGMREFPALGADGASGVKGRRRTGVIAALGAAVLFDLAGNATRIITGDEKDSDSDLAAALGAAAGNATSRVAEEYLGRLLGRGPRFRVQPGVFMNVVVEEDMRLPSLGGS